MVIKGVKDMSVIKQYGDVVLVNLIVRNKQKPVMIPEKKYRMYCSELQRSNKIEVSI